MIIAKSATRELLIENGAICVGTGDDPEFIFKIMGGGIDFEKYVQMARMDVYTHKTVISADEANEFGLKRFNIKAKLVDLWYVPHAYTMFLPNIYANPYIFTQEFINAVHT